jgi:ketosteroid isomerase-like protein
VVQDEDGTEQVLNQITGMWSRLVRNPTEDHDVTERADATRTISIPEFLSYVDIMRRNEQVFEKQDDGKWKVRSMRHPL